LLNKGQEMTEEDLDQLPMSYWSEIQVDNESVENELGRIIESTTTQVNLIKQHFEDKIEKLKAATSYLRGHQNGQGFRRDQA
jgi:hypothetical protein